MPIKLLLLSAALAGTLAACDMTDMGMGTSRSGASNATDARDPGGVDDFGTGNSLDGTAGSDVP